MWAASLAFCFATACLLTAGSLHAAVYHVDYAAGDDARDGLTPETAWKRSPGDAKAEGKAAAAALAPGDTIRFKGGVTYQGNLRIAVSGAAGQPITLDGNLDGTYGTGPAVIDGGKILSGWKKFTAAAEVQDHPRWSDLFYVDIPLDIGSNFNHGSVVLHRQEKHDRQAPWQRIILGDGDNHLLPIAQLPKPKDRFYPDLPGGFFKTQNRLETKVGLSAVVDPANLTATDPSYYNGMFLGVHGGNNHVYFAAVAGFEPAANRLTFAQFKPSTYPNTSYALFNAPKLISEPGEWCIAPVGDKLFRITLLPERLVDGLPANIGFPELLTGIEIADGASHLAIRGFLIQRFSGGGGAVSIAKGAKRSSGIAISDCEIRFVSGHAGIGPHHCDDITIENCYIHHCPSWTTAIFLNRVNRYAVRDCYLVKNSGSGIRHYESKNGEITGNAILDHYGMHSSTINVYEGCADVTIEGNYLHNTLAINRNAERITIRNNVIDSQNKSVVNSSMWISGSVGGKDLKDIHFLNNTFVNVSRGQDWSTAIFCQSGKGASAPKGVIVRDNVLDRLTAGLPGAIAGNIYLREVDPKYLGENCVVVEDQAALFVDPSNGDFRRKPGGPNMGAGANVPPPPKEWRGRRKISPAKTQP
ncbi:MAG: right-handed parallel beta-helix repeat-containing protein [Planctomycetes bacterium]|nr:right-handed parallel beta-helix repeat-containing protein [Planctomycetota bacterium]